MDRDAALQRFDQLLENLFLDNSMDEAMAIWRHTSAGSAVEARADLEAFDAVLADPPADLNERLAEHGGIHLFHRDGRDVVPFTEGERDAWLRDLAARMRAEL
jgi:hypothetical protein